MFTIFTPFFTLGPGDGSLTQPHQPQEACPWSNTCSVRAGGGHS